MNDDQFYGLVVGAVVLTIIVMAIAVIVVVSIYIIRYIQRQRLQRPVQDEELALLTLSFNDKTTDGISFDYMENVLVTDFGSSTNSGPTIIEPSMNTTSSEADNGSSQSALPSETEMDLEQNDNINECMDQEVCAVYETNDRHSKSCMVYTGMSGYNVLSPLIVNGKVVGPTPVEDDERFEYENGRIDSYEGNEEICVPDFKTVAPCQENDAPLPDQYECSTQSGSPVVSAMPSSSKYSVLICTATTNRKKELSDSSSTREHQKSHSKANVSDLLCGSFSADEKMPSSTEVIHEGGLSSNEVVLEKTMDSKETDEEADGKAARGGIKPNEQAVMPAISPHQNDNNEDSTHR